MTVPRHPPLLGGSVARLRRWWWLHVRRYRGELCQFCGGPYRDFVWWAANDLWEAVSAERPLGLCCPACFDREASRLGFGVLVWRPISHEDDFIERETERAIAAWQAKSAEERAEVEARWAGNNRA